MVEQFKTSEEFLSELQQLKHENQLLTNECLEIKLANDSFRKKIMNCESIFESSPVAMFIIDESTNIVMANLAAVKLCGGSEEEILQHRPGNALRCVHSVKDPRGCGYAPDCKTCNVRNGIESLIANGGTISGAELEFTLTQNDKPQSVWMNVGVEPVMKEGVKHWCIAMNDISESKHIEESLRISEERFRGIFNNLQDAFFQADLSGNFILVSPSALRIYGYDSLDELIGMPASNLYANYNDRDQLINELREKANINDHVVLGKRKDGSSFWVSMNVRIIYQNGKLLGTEGIVRDITERIQTEQKLTESKTLLKSIIDSTLDMIWSVDSERFGLLNWNTSFFNYFLNDRGIEIGIGMTPGDLFPADSEYIAFWTNLFRRTLEEGSLSVEYKTFSGTRFLNMSLNLLKNDKTTFGISIFAKDITKRKQAEGALKEKEEEYRTLVENLSVGLVVHDANSAIILSNNAASKFLGLTDDQMKGRSAIDPSWGFLNEDLTIMPVDDYPANRILASGKPLKNYLVGINKPNSGDLTWVICNGYPVFDHYEKIKSIVITFADITSRKNAEVEVIHAKEKIEESEYRLKLATASGGLGIWDWNLVENTMIWDDRMFELYGISRDTFPNNIDAWTNGLHPEDKQMALDECNAALNGEREFNTSFRILHPDGTVLYLKADGSVIRDKNGKPIRMIGINRDVTENRLAAIQLLIEKEKAEESDRLKSAFLANMSHEIRTPLNSIIGFSDLLIDPDFDPDQKQEFVTLIKNSGNNLISIINDIIDISKIETGQVPLTIEQFSMNQLINEIGKEFSYKAEEKGLKFLVNQPESESPVTIKSDPTRMKQILTSFLNNAIKFTEKGFVELGFIETTDSVHIFVKDSGIGIAKQYHEQIFERFWQVESAHTRKYGGNGLGLAISKQLADLLGYKLWLESEPGKGSTFYISASKT